MVVTVSGGFPVTFASTATISGITSSVVPGTGATNLGKAVQAVGGATDTGVAILAIRDDALTTLTPNDGQYAQLRLTADGALWTESAGGTLNAVTNITNTVIVSASGDRTSGGAYTQSDTNGVPVLAGVTLPSAIQNRAVNTYGHLLTDDEGSLWVHQKTCSYGTWCSSGSYIAGGTSPAGVGAPLYVGDANHVSIYGLTESSASHVMYVTDTTVSANWDIDENLWKTGTVAYPDSDGRWEIQLSNFAAPYITFGSDVAIGVTASAQIWYAKK